MSDAAGGSAGLLDRLLRPGRSSRRDVAVDLLWLLGLGLLLMGAGLGLRDPWPADEPRFALIAQDMLRSSDWLFPRVAGDLYADKPPLFFWLMASAMAATGSLRIGFLLPSLAAGLGTLALVYDLLRRVRGREVALAGGLVLLLTFQFVWQARQAQIDATLCFLTTLSLYGLLRHLAAGPARGWFLAGWFAAGLGVITKGVGFLPLLILLPVAALARRRWPVSGRFGMLSAAGLACALGAMALWLVPMLAATSGSPDLESYRDEILFQQTVTRYADAWHHHEPFWYFVVQVIPVQWLPLIALLPWLVPRWRQAWRDRDTFVIAVLAWVVLVVLFFSTSSGKRGVYVLPAVPALAMAAAPWLPGLLRADGPRRVAFALATVLAAVTAAAAVAAVAVPELWARVANDGGLRPLLPLVVMAVGCGAALAAFRPKHGWLAYLGCFATVLVTTGLLLYPRMDAVRSGRAFMERVERAADDIAELGLVGPKEQFLLQSQRPTFHFGHARWREWEAEAADASAWLAAAPGRALVVGEDARRLCLNACDVVDLGRASRQHWSLVSCRPKRACVRRGDPSRATLYVPARAAASR